MATAPLNHQVNKLHERCKAPSDELVFSSTSPLSRWGKTMAVIVLSMILIALFAGVSRHDADVLLQAESRDLNLGWVCEVG